VARHRLSPARWEVLAAEPEFRTLLKSRRRFVVPATTFFILYYFALPISVGLFPKEMSRPVLGSLTVAYVFALSQFAMAWILLALYLRRARSFDVQAAKIRRQETRELLETES
jgi:uncharacterized membrane protein (DUF485 family)